MTQNSSIQYTECTRCILTVKDYPKIVFNEIGVCDICHINDMWTKKFILSGDLGKTRIDRLLKMIRMNGKGKEYDCLIGVSGGVDSTYLAYLCKKWGLKPLVLHVDNGWNSELAVMNIEKIIQKLELDLYTVVLNWQEMKDLQLSFLKSNVIDIDLPFDNAFMAVLYQTAAKFKIKYILLGHNTVTEGYLPPNFSHFKLDRLNILDIHKKFGTIQLKTFPTMGYLQKWKFEKINKIRVHNPLDWIDFNKTDAMKTIKEKLEWREYGEKHFENIYTRFYQGYILPRKFNVEKRKAHLSVLICSGQITREQAIQVMEKSPYNEELLHQDKTFFIKKLGITEEEFERIMQQPEVPHTFYKSEINIIRKLQPFGKMLRKLGLRK